MELIEIILHLLELSLIIAAHYRLNCSIKCAGTTDLGSTEDSKEEELLPHESKDSTVIHELNPG